MNNEGKVRREIIDSVTYPVLKDLQRILGFGPRDSKQARGRYD